MDKHHTHATHVKHPASHKTDGHTHYTHDEHPSAHRAKPHELTALPREGWIASAQPSVKPEQALNGLSHTRSTTGAPQADGQWYQLDMLAPQSFSRIVMDSTGSPGDHPRGYKVLVSNDGTRWGEPIASGEGSSDVVTVDFPPQTARFIRVVQTGAAANWWSIHEFNVFG